MRAILWWSKIAIETFAGHFQMPAYWTGRGYHDSVPIKIREFGVIHICFMIFTWKA